MNSVQKRFLENNRLTVHCKIQISEDQTDFYKTGKIQDSFRFYFLSKKLSDVILVVEGKEIPSHSQILAMRSEVFKRLFFEKNMLETKKLFLSNISYVVGLEMLRFCYTDAVRDLDKVVKELLVAAILYDIKQLIKVCIRCIQKQINVFNVIEFLEYADKSLIIELKMFSMEFIKSNARDVKESGSWKKLIPNHNLMLEVCSKLDE